MAWGAPRGVGTGPGVRVSGAPGGGGRTGAHLAAGGWRGGVGGGKQGGVVTAQVRRPEPTLQVRTSGAGACLPKAPSDLEAPENRLGAE